jgi:formate/nitrite transporter
MPEVVAICKGPKEAYEGMVDKGVELGNKSSIKIFHQSLYAGFYIGFGGMLSMVVAGGLDEAAKDNPTIQTFVFAALFPVNLLIILLTGACLITGTSATVPAAVYEKKLHWMHIPRTFAISWLGNLIGGIIFAAVITYCDMNVGLTAKLAIKVAEKKIKKDFFITFIKGIGCNWLVCMAVFLSGQAQDMAGKMVGIWFPISCFVAIGFEHIPANMFMIPMGMMAGADVSVVDCFVKNFLPVTLGNLFAGSIAVAAGYSFAFGALGQNKPSHLPVSRVSREDLDTATIDQMEKNQKEAKAKEMSAIPDAGKAA